MEHKYPNFFYEKKVWRWGFTVVAGVDEVGRGSWVGPVVASAVAFAPFSIFHLLFLIGDRAFRITDSITDSKKMGFKVIVNGTRLSARVIEVF